MENSRMSNADMIQYCDEALAWEEFGPVDIYFFESVKKILLGQCSPIEEAEEQDDLLGIERPVRADELASDYHKYADEYYEEEGEISETPEKPEKEAFSEEIFSEGFFNEENASEVSESGNTENSTGSFTVNI